MALTLVPKYVRSLAEQLNAYYRVLRGIDPDSVYFRLNGGGSFEVRHSGTNAAVFTVNDGGIAGSISGGNIQNESITSAQIQNGTIVAADIADGAVTSAKILDNEIVNADINANAAILLNKLNHVGAGNVLKSNGTTNQAGQVVNADIAPGANIDGAKLLDGSVTSAKITDLTIMNGDVNAAAGILITKLADLGANNVLRSNGAGNLAGKIVTNDMGLNTINGDRLLDSSIASSKLSGGAPPPAGSGAADAWKAYATDAAGTTVALRQLEATHLAAGAGMRKLLDTTVGAPVGFIQTGLISQAYSDLRLVLESANTTLATINIYVELCFDAGGVTPDGGPYDWLYQNQVGSVSAAAGGAIIADTGLAIGSHYQSYHSSLIAELPLYTSGLTKHVYGRCLFMSAPGAASYTMQATVGLHRTNANPIKGLKVYPGSGQFNTGARLMLFGTPGTLG
jgi:hypothetical protein